jgi:L-amino acid N-acyltransferase YncA/protein-tyrosine-phosphatase
MRTARQFSVRDAASSDLAAIRSIYNQGIEDRIATLEEAPKTEDEILRWYQERGDRYSVLVATEGDSVVGWASLNPYSHRCAYDGVADLSVYVRRDARGEGVGSQLLREIERAATRNGFHKIVLFAFPSNQAGRQLYIKSGFRDVGTFREQGRLDGKFVDVIALEKILKPLVLFVCKHNAGRSQMAEAYLRHFAGDRVEVSSAGTAAADAPDPNVVAAMAEDGIDIVTARPKLLDAAIAQRAAKIITMGCDVLACDLQGMPHIDEDWGLPDPHGQPIETVRKIRDTVKAKAQALADEI